MSTSPLVLHIVRPYATADEYLAAEAWTIDARAMLLVEAAELPPDTAVLFDVALANGDKLIRAEGKVAAVIPAQGNRPGGLRVRFKRYGAATKAFIDRAVQAQKAPAPPDAAPVSAAPVSRNSITELEMQKAEAVAPAVIEVAAPPAPLVVPVPVPESRPETSVPSGVRLSDPGPIDVPRERDALLARLRERAPRVDLDTIPQRMTAKAS
ncbi:MAG TPA: hypothetical protein VM686_23025 [Polyangiaceae bacterium]|nr:hypothetical protein [Polyangiaceae bacterium]